MLTKQLEGTKKKKLFDKISTMFLKSFTSQMCLKQTWDKKFLQNFLLALNFLKTF